MATKTASKPAAKKPQAKSTSTKPKSGGSKTSTSKPKATEPELRHEAVGAVFPNRPSATPVVHVDNRTRRSDKDGLEGHFVVVVSGEHKGLRGVFREVASTEKDGYPKRILVRARDHAGDEDLVTVNYADVRPDNYREPKDEK